MPTQTPTLTLLTSPRWRDYELLDSGQGLKLERWGPYRFVRPEAQAIWRPRLPEREWQRADATFDADLGVSHERTEVRDPDGRALEVDLWTGCYTPRELRLLLGRHDLAVERISSVEPGAYGDDPPTTESPELLVLAHRR